MGYIGVGRKYSTNAHNQWLMEIKPISMAMVAAWVRSEAPYAGAASLDKEEPTTSGIAVWTKDDFLGKPFYEVGCLRPSSEG
jgi:hypothetical protein